MIWRGSRSDFVRTNGRPTSDADNTIYLILSGQFFEHFSAVLRLWGHTGMKSFMTRKPNPLSPASSFSFSRSASHLDFIQISFVCPFNSFITVLYFSLTLVLARIHEDFARIMKTFMRNNAQLRGFFSGKTFFVQK